MNDKPLPRREAAVWTGILSDVALAVAKGSIGYFAGSKALMGDAFYSGADAAAKLAGVIPWNPKQSNKTAAARSRTVQGSKEPMAAILLAVLILMGGLQIAFSAIRDLTRGNLSAPGQSALIAVLLCIVFKEAIFQYQYRYFKKKGDGSHAAYADNHRFSLYTSITVFIGIALAMTGGYLNWHPLLYMDPIAALLAGCLIIRKGYALITSSVYSNKQPQELPSKEAASFIETVQRVHGVIRVEHLKALEQGSYVNLHVKISVNPRISVMEAQDISECARKLLQHRFVHVGEVHMDVVPYDPGYPYKSNHELADNDVPTLLQ
ncbi:cation diffusion facilitator family transporter [Paenibacillus sp. MMS20-IR301]|uniref:cation diffusion facilitator family transporter n=1 Tax=Paenibacillus sp. MMS20-IR301 TaxID=2895946 RepID=UPI0028E53F4B|nr:cation diffusion facilitator family transporter [Paenibacillus sp. MMS20-IR301]WNS43654.1 cation diffusion facilitator family transporter [Paenibacillus sp. MMS20-IR301]